MRTPEQIAIEIHERFASTASSAAGERITLMKMAAIEADRRQRDIYEYIALDLNHRAENWGGERGKQAARVARRIRDEDLYEMLDEHIGRMLDAITEQFGQPTSLPGDGANTEPPREMRSGGPAPDPETGRQQTPAEHAYGCTNQGDDVEVPDAGDEHHTCAAAYRCDECSGEATNFYPNLTEPVQLCDSCDHNARRSGWEPGQ